jgi:hypothetical protein
MGNTVDGMRKTGPSASSCATAFDRRRVLIEGSGHQCSDTFR